MSGPFSTMMSAPKLRNSRVLAPLGAAAGAAGGGAIRVVLDGSTGAAGRMVSSAAGRGLGFVRRIMKTIKRKRKAAPAAINR